MSGEWRELPIGDVATVIGGGTPSTKDGSNFNGSIPWLTPKDLSGYPYRYISHGERNINEKGLMSSSARLLPEGAVLLTTRAPVGYVAIASNSVTTNQGFKSLVLQEGFHPEFIYYLLKSKTDLLKAHASGTTFGELSGTTLKGLRFMFPPLPKQCAIAAVLSSLDDKIELNRQMNQTLEVMAQAIFKSWFVDFEPFRDKGMEELPLGEIPKGWNTDKLSKLCSTQYGYTASANDEPVGPHLLRVTDINKQNWIEWTSVPYCQIEEQDKPKYTLDVGDIVVARMADPGKSAIIEQPIDAVFASYLVRLKTESLAYAYYVYGFLKSRAYAEYSEGAMGGSSVQKSMNAKVIVDTDLVIPPRKALEAFLDYILPLRGRLVANVEQAANLAAIRDTLLPKLLSGEIRIKDAEKFVERAV